VQRRGVYELVPFGRRTSDSRKTRNTQNQELGKLRYRPLSNFVSLEMRTRDETVHLKREYATT
jgi:hypothetical protein